MGDLFLFIKILAIAQMIVVCWLVLLAYALKIYTFYITRRNQRINKKIESVLLACIKQDAEFNLKSIRRYRRHTALIIDIIAKFENVITEKKDRWEDIRKKIIVTILLPRSRVLARSKEWLERYVACQIFQLALENYDKAILEELINDSIPLVAINAAVVAIRSDSQTLIDAVIDTFAQGRRVQQSVYAQIISEARPTLIPLIANRLDREKNPYFKAFCYRMLTALPFVADIVETASVDINDDNIDLKLAVLSYYHRNDYKQLGKLLLVLLKDSRWEIRARAVKLVGEKKDLACISLLEECLKDPMWWVRINAAAALANLGENGLFILKNQTPTADRFAYDAARLILSTRT